MDQKPLKPITSNSLISFIGNKNTHLKVDPNTSTIVFQAQKIDFECSEQIDFKNQHITGVRPAHLDSDIVLLSDLKEMLLHHQIKKPVVSKVMLVNCITPFQDVGQNVFGEALYVKLPLGFKSKFQSDLAICQSIQASGQPLYDKVMLESHKLYILRVRMYVKYSNTTDSPIKISVDCGKHIDYHYDTPRAFDFQSWVPIYQDILLNLTTEQHQQVLQISVYTNLNRGSTKDFIIDRQSFIEVEELIDYHSGSCGKQSTESDESLKSSSDYIKSSAQYHDENCNCGR